MYVGQPELTTKKKECVDDTWYSSGYSPSWDGGSLLKAHLFYLWPNSQVTQGKNTISLGVTGNRYARAKCDTWASFHWQESELLQPCPSAYDVGASWRQHGHLPPLQSGAMACVCTRPFRRIRLQNKGVLLQIRGLLLCLCLSSYQTKTVCSLLPNQAQISRQSLQLSVSC